MSWDVTNNALSIIVSNSNGYSKTIDKTQVQAVLEADDSYLRLKYSQSPYLDIAWWDSTTISSLTGATTIADGFTILTGYLESNT
jgi:hypothetical protein